MIPTVPIADVSGIPMSEPEDVQPWRPIETAPDEMLFSAIVATPLDSGSYFVEEAWWDHARQEWWPANTDFSDAHGAAIHPTHWMPLPPPPGAEPAPLKPLDPDAIDMIADDGKRSATGGIYATQVYDFAADCIAEFCRINGLTIGAEPAKGE